MRCLFDDPYPLANGSILKVLALALLASTALLLLTVYLNNTSLSCHKELYHEYSILYRKVCGSTSHYILHLVSIISINNVLFIFLVQLSVVRYPALNRILTSDYSLKDLSNGVFRLAIALIYMSAISPGPLS